MPIYDFKCTGCGKEEERIVPHRDVHAQKCKSCMYRMKMFWKKGYTFVEFKPRMFNGFPGHPNKDVLVESKKQLRQLCKDNDCSSVYLMDG